MKRFKKLLKIFQALRALKVIKMLRNLFVLKTGLNFRIFLRLEVRVLRSGRRSWSLFCSFCETSLNSLLTSSWLRSQSLTKASLYEQRGKMMRIARFCTPNPKPLLKTVYLRQLCSSSPLEQSCFPSHTAVVRRHASPWQRNMLEGHSQSSSSDSSLHAKSPSQKRFFSTHSPFLHLNCLSLHLKSEKLVESVQSGLLIVVTFFKKWMSHFRFCNFGKWTILFVFITSDHATAKMQ